MKKKTKTLSVTFGNTWWKEDNEPGKPQGKHEPGEVHNFASLATLGAALSRLSQPLDTDLPRDIAKTHQPYVVWSALDMSGDRRRRAYNVLPSRLLPFDIDGCHPMLWKRLIKRLAPFEYLYYYTASDNPQKRRVRLVLVADRTLPDVKEACLRTEQMLMTALGAEMDGSMWTTEKGVNICFDRSMNDPAHFAFLPPGGSRVQHHEGAAVCVADLPELNASMQHAVRTQHHTKDHARRMREFNKDPEANRQLIEQYLNNELKEAANTNARSDGTYGWGRICGALSDFIGTDHEDWARELLVSWSVEHGGEWAEASGLDEYQQDQSIRDEFGKWTNPYKTIFDLVGKIRKAERESFVESLTDEDLTDGLPRKKRMPKNVPALLPESGKFEPYGAELQAELDQKGDVVATYNCAENVRWVLDQRKAQVCINEMTGEMELFYTNGRVISDYEVMLSELTNLATFHRIPVSTLERHLRRIAIERSYHPVRGALHGREWDGTERVERVLACFNFEKPEYAIPIMRKWLLGAIAAVMLEDHFEAKLVPILVGKQSSFKSNAISRMAGLVPRQFHDEQIELKDKDSLIRAVGSHIVEWAEMGNLHRADVDKVKAFISRKTDTYRPAYGRTSVRKRRQSVFIGTANPNGRPLLADQSGNLRFAPLALSVVDIDRLNGLLGWSYDSGRLRRSDPEQLSQFWLELVALYHSGESWHVTGALRDMQEAENESYTTTDPYEMQAYDFLTQWEHEPRAWRTATQIAKELGFTAAQCREMGIALTRLSTAGHIEVKTSAIRSKKSNQYAWPLPGGVRGDPENDLSD